MYPGRFELGGDRLGFNAGFVEVLNVFWREGTTRLASVVCTVG